MPHVNLSIEATWNYSHKSTLKNTSLQNREPFSTLQDSSGIKFKSLKSQCCLLPMELNFSFLWSRDGLCYITNFSIVPPLCFSHGVCLVVCRLVSNHLSFFYFFLTVYPVFWCTSKGFARGSIMAIFWHESSHSMICSSSSNSESLIALQNQ